MGYKETSLAGLCLLILAVSGEIVNSQDNEVDSSGHRGIRSGEELVDAVAEDCLVTDSSPMSCLRLKVLSYLDSKLGSAIEARSLEEEHHLDELIFSRVARYVKSHQFRVQLPEFLFQGATVTYRPGKSLADFDVDFPEEPKEEDPDVSQARGMLKKKLLLPVLLLLKLKMKALMPIFVALIGLKAMKALVLSKVAILLVVGFLIVQLCKKAGMMPMMPMAMPMEPATPYGAPAPSPPASSYDTSSWDAGNSNTQSGGPYARVWDPHQMAYNAYYSSNTQQQPQASQQTTNQQ